MENYSADKIEMRVIVFLELLVGYLCVNAKALKGNGLYVNMLEKTVEFVRNTLQDYEDCRYQLREAQQKATDFEKLLNEAKSKLRAVQNPNLEPNLKTAIEKRLADYINTPNYKSYVESLSRNIMSGNYIMAIKLWREFTRMDLAGAKMVIESIGSEVGLYTSTGGWIPHA